MRLKYCLKCLLVRNVIEIRRGFAYFFRMAGSIVLKKVSSYDLLSLVSNQELQSDFYKQEFN